MNNQKRQPVVVVFVCFVKGNCMPSRKKFKYKNVSFVKLDPYVAS